MAMNLDATDVRWRHLYGLRAFDSGLNEAAEAAFRAVRLVKPSYAPALERLALLLMERGGDAEAAALFE